MGNNTQINPPYAGVHFKPILVKADDSEGTINTVPAGAVSVVVTDSIETSVNDFIVLPKLADVRNGHEINIQCAVGANFEMRTPVSSNEKINNKDCDSTNEYLCTDTEVIKVIKIDNTIGWMAHAYSAIGAVVTAVVPD